MESDANCTGELNKNFGNYLSRAHMGPSTDTVELVLAGFLGSWLTLFLTGLAALVYFLFTF